MTTTLEAQPSTPAQPIVSLKEWGLFDKEGKAVALGDAWHHWKCPAEKVEPAGYVHDITGEWIDEGLVPVACPFKRVGVKLDRCETCGMEFRYP